MLGKRKRSYSKSSAPNAKRRRTAYRRVRRTVRKPRNRKSSVRRTLPDYTVVAFKYQNMIKEFTLNGVPQTTRQWRMNSLYDPNATLTNPGQHQPYGYDQYSVFFQKYRVFGVKMTFHFFNPTLDTSTGAVADRDLYCAIWPSPDATTPLPGTNMNIIGEVAKGKQKVFNRKDGIPMRQTLTGYWAMNKLLGVSKKEYNTDQNFEAFVGQNPMTTPYMNVMVYNPFNTSDTARYDLKLNFTYYASMFRKRIPDMS